MQELAAIPWSTLKAAKRIECAPGSIERFNRECDDELVRRGYGPRAFPRLDYAGVPLVEVEGRSSWEIVL
jgi:hypothetical protein